MNRVAYWNRECGSLDFVKVSVCMLVFGYFWTFLDIFGYCCSRFISNFTLLPSFESRNCRRVEYEVKRRSPRLMIGIVRGTSIINGRTSPMGNTHFAESLVYHGMFLQTERPK